MNWVWARCIEEFHNYRGKPPQDNLLSHFAHEKMDGRYITEEEMLSFSNNILAGGVDTTTALTTHALVHLCQHPADRQRLIDDMDLLPIAREEFVRYFTPMHGTARNAQRDVAVDGQRSRRATASILRGRPQIATPRCSTIPSRWTSPAFPIAISASELGRTAALARSWLARGSKKWSKPFCNEFPTTACMSSRPRCIRASVPSMGGSTCR